MDCRPVHRGRALEVLIVCNGGPPPWWEQANWHLCRVEESDFLDLLVYDGGRPDSRWQEFSNGEYILGKVAGGLDKYVGSDAELLRWRDFVLEYEKKMDNGQFPKTLCLVKTDDGPLTLFDTNRRALALYLHYFIFKKRRFQSLDGLLAIVRRKLDFQSE